MISKKKVQVAEAGIPTCSTCAYVIKTGNKFAAYRCWPMRHALVPQEGVCMRHPKYNDHAWVYDDKRLVFMKSNSAWLFMLTKTVPIRVAQAMVGKTGNWWWECGELTCKKYFRNMLESINNAYQCLVYGTKEPCLRSETNRRRKL